MGYVTVSTLLGLYRYMQISVKKLNSLKYIVKATVAESRN